LPDHQYNNYFKKTKREKEITLRRRGQAPQGGTE